MHDIGSVLYVHLIVLTVVFISLVVDVYIFFELDVRICAFLYLMHDVNYGRAVVYRLIPDAAAIVISCAGTYPRNRATVR